MKCMYILIWISCDMIFLYLFPRLISLRFRLLHIFPRLTVGTDGTYSCPLYFLGVKSSKLDYSQAGKT